MIIFENTGALDVRAITVVGLTSKDGETTIGRFGTGFKYGLAVATRLGGKVSISLDGVWHEISTSKDEFRGAEYHKLIATPEAGDPFELPFTAELGRDWEPWMAFREFYANAIDEGGTVTHAEGRPDEAGGDRTLIAVEWDAFEAVFYSMDEHFIDPTDEPIYTDTAPVFFEVYEGRSKFVFYKGIAIMELPDPAAFRYNLLGSVDLTEDRTAKYDFQVKSVIQTYLAQSTDSKVCEAAADRRGAYEATLDFSGAYSPSREFLGATVELGVNANPTAQALVRKQLPDDPGDAHVIDTNDPQGVKLNKGLQVLRKLGCDLGDVKFVIARGVDMVSDYDTRGDAVYLKEEALNGSDKRAARAVVKGFAAVTENRHWMADTLIEKSGVKMDIKGEDGIKIGSG